MTDRRKNRPASASERDWFAWLIDPVTVDAFERDYYEQRLLHIAREPSAYYADLLSVADLDTVLGTHAAKHPDVSLVNGDGEISLEQYASSAGRIQPLDAARLFDDGATLVFRQLQERVPALAQLCVALGKHFSSRVQTNIYLTPAHAQGFAPHWDTHDVFVLQVSGAKRWTIYDTKVELPLRGQRFVRGTPPGDVSSELELGPGSALYLPRGLTHAARSTGEASLHVTLGLTAFTWAEFLVECVNAAALEEESLRRNLPLGFSGEGFSAAERERAFEEKLALLGERFSPDAVWRRFADEVLASDVPLFDDLLSQRLRQAPLTPQSRVRRRPHLIVRAERENGRCVVRYSGRELSLPAHVWPALEFATTVQEFAVQDMPDCLDSEGKLTLATRLVREGVLQGTEIDPI